MQHRKRRHLEEWASLLDERLPEDAFDERGSVDVAPDRPDSPPDA